MVKLTATAHRCTNRLEVFKVIKVVYWQKDVHIIVLNLLPSIIPGPALDHLDATPVLFLLGV